MATVLDPRGDWVALARVPRRRLGWVHAAIASQTLWSNVEVDGSSAAHRSVSLTRIGPPVAPEETTTAENISGEANHWIEFRVSAEQIPPDDAAWRSGAPGRVMMHCGHVSLGWWLVGDAMSWTRDQVAGFFGVWR